MEARDSRMPFGYAPVGSEMAREVRTQGRSAIGSCSGAGSGEMVCVTPGCCAVPGKGSHNNTVRTLERSLLAAGTDGYADTESGTSHECAVRVPKGLQRLEHYVLTHNLSQVDLSAA